MVGASRAVRPPLVSRELARILSLSPAFSLLRQTLLEEGEDDGEHSRSQFISRFSVNALERIRVVACAPDAPQVRPGPD